MEFVFDDTISLEKKQLMFGTQKAKFGEQNRDIKKLIECLSIET